MFVIDALTEAILKPKHYDDDFKIKLMVKWKAFVEIGMFAKRVLWKFLNCSSHAKQ